MLKNADEVYNICAMISTKYYDQKIDFSVVASTLVVNTSRSASCCFAQISCDEIITSLRSPVV